MQYSTSQKLNAVAIVDEMVARDVGSGGSSIAAEAVDSATYAPGYTAGDPATLAVDTISGGLLTHNRRLTSTDDEVRSLPGYESSDAPTSITSTSLTYVRSSAIDLRGYNRISVFPNVATAGGTTGYYKVAWSADGINWWEETIDSVGTVSGGESIIIQSVMVRSFDSATTGYKTLSAATFDKRARYFSILQRSDAAVTLTTSYNYQRC